MCITVEKILTLLDHYINLFYNRPNSTCEKDIEFYISKYRMDVEKFEC